MAKISLFLIFWLFGLGVLATANASEAGETAPACVLPGLDSPKPTVLGDLRGKVLYVDFWASWCPPCLKSFPFLNELHKDFNKQGLEVVAVNMDEEAQDARDFIAKHPANFGIVTDPDSRCAENFAVKAMPSSYLIDRKGVIRHVHLGFRADSVSELRGLIDKLVKEH